MPSPPGRDPQPHTGPPPQGIQAAETQHEPAEGETDEEGPRGVEEGSHAQRLVVAGATDQGEDEDQQDVEDGGEESGHVSTLRGRS